MAIPSQRQSGMSYWTWLKTYKPEQFKKYQKYHSKQVLACKRRRFEENLELEKEKARISSQEYRTKFAKQWNKYNREYQKKWLSDPINKRTHQLTCGLKSAIETGGHKKFKSISKTIEYIQSHMRQGMVVSHAIPIRHLIRFNFNLPIYVIHDLSNIEVTTRAENSRLRHFITDVSIDVAEVLEKKFPLECNGLVKWLKKEQPKFQPRYNKYLKGA